MKFEPVVAELMTPDPAVLAPSDRMGTAAREMDLCSIRHLPVVDGNGVLVGLLSQRDVLACDDPDVRVAELMSRDLMTVTPETAAHEAAYLLVRHKIGCLPVVGEHGLLVGILTETDFVRAAIVLLGGRVTADQLEEEEAEGAPRSR